MTRFRDLSVRRKLLVIVMVASGGALLAANAALVVSDLLLYRRQMVRDLETLAQIVAENSTAAVSFDDPRAAGETLAALRARRAVAMAAIYRADGRRFAQYVRAGARGELPPRPQTDGARFAAGSLLLFQPIALAGRRIGTVFLAADLGEMYGQVRLQAFTVTLVLVGAAVISLLLASRLERLISAPIRDLAETARDVSGRRDYSIRAGGHGGDEIGRLVGAFNEMLAQVEDRDRELLRVKEELERRVEERTQELRLELAERRRAERELAQRNELLDQSNRELDDFAHIASHDLKEPLRGIHNFSLFLLEDYADKLDDPGQAKLATLVRLTQRMESLIESLLHYSRVGRVDLAIDRVDLNPILAAVIESLAIGIAERAVEVRIPRPLPAVRCDRARVGEIFRNLIANAVKYNDKPAGRWVEIGCGNGGAAAGLPVFYVRDNGIGIPEKHFEAIFRIFKRLHGRDQFGGGTGAGLTIVKKIVERHRGRVWVESTPGAGSTFYFTLEEEIPA